MVLCALFVAPGAFNVSNVTFVSPTVVDITIEEVSACTYIHSTSFPLSVTHMFLYLQMQLNVDSGLCCHGYMPPLPLPVLRCHPTALRSQHNGTTSPLGEVMVLPIRQNKWKRRNSLP